MQNEIDAEGWAVAVRILGINEIGSERDNDLMCAGRDLPWLQETASNLVWVPWAVTNRDVIILDRNNRQIGIYNLTEHDLSQATNFAELKGLLQAAAAGG